MEMTPEAIKALLDAFDRSDWREMTVTVGNDRLHVSRDAPSANGAMSSAAAASPEPAAGTPMPAPTGAPASDAPAAAAGPPARSVALAATPATEAPPSGTAIEAPSVGLFWRAPAPGAPPFVEVGSRVSTGDTVAIVEVMKLMNHVASPVDGVVSAILADNGAAVEFGQPIVVVDPEG